MTLKAMPIEGEPFVRDAPLELMAPYSYIAVRWEAETLERARALLLCHAPDVTFLGVQLRDGDAFGLMPDLPRSTHVVFVAGVDAYAIRAFEVSALDYLLKPVTRTRFEVTLSRLPSVSRNSMLRAPAVSGLDPARILIKNGMRREFVEFEQAVLVTCLGGKYTELWTTDDRRIETRRTIQQWANLLDKHAFVRVSRSSLVGLAHVVRERVSSARGVELDVSHLADPVAVSRRLAPQVLSALERYGGQLC